MKHGTFTEVRTQRELDEINEIANKYLVENYAKINEPCMFYAECTGEIVLHNHMCIKCISNPIPVSPEEFVRQLKEHFAEPVNKKVQELERELADTKAELEKLKAKQVKKSRYLDFSGFVVHDDGNISKHGIWLYKNGDGDTLDSKNAIWVSGDSIWQPVLEQNPTGNWAFYIKKKD